ncbi:MAG TPA: cation diffusion facilitator family transporter [Candidatus Limnocylindria bacterium]|nr:cation diffusion facilitator family transporter [Candidatus Limnocylindria bacterium]
MTATANDGVRLRAALASLGVGIVLLGGKYVGYVYTGSAAVLSDALESIINVVAAIFLLATVVFAGRPRDRDHPYGHGKIEYFSAVFEGGLISFAALLIAWYAVMDLLRGPAVRQVELGMLITLVCGLGNAALGWYLIRTGRREQSIGLVADGHHVLSDFWTSAGVVVGLLLVRVTGFVWLDPLTAIVVAVNLAVTGGRLVRNAAGGLLDEEDTRLLSELVRAFESRRDPGLIRIHSLRAIRAGRFTHVDAHLIVPEYWTVEQAHRMVDAFEQRVLDSCSVEGEIAFHTDPCARALCRLCEMPDCPVRQAPLETRPPLTIDEARLSDAQFWKRHGVELGPDLSRQTA